MFGLLRVSIVQYLYTPILPCATSASGRQVSVKGQDLVMRDGPLFYCNIPYQKQLEHDKSHQPTAKLPRFAAGILFIFDIKTNINVGHSTEKARKEETLVA